MQNVKTFSRYHYNIYVILGYNNCDKPEPPRNGAIIFQGGFLRATCRRNFYPIKPFALAYQCRDGDWEGIFAGKLEKFEPCIGKYVFEKNL